MMCLYALRDYRATAMRLSSPKLQPLARETFPSTSRWLGMTPETQDVLTPRCVS